MSAEDIKLIHQKLDALIEGQAVVQERVANACDDLSKLQRDYYGNGDGGTRRDITALKTKMAGLLWGVAAIGGAAISALVMTIWDHIRKA